MTKNNGTTYTVAQINALTDADVAAAKVRTIEATKTRAGLSTIDYVLCQVTPGTNRTLDFAKQTLLEKIGKLPRNRLISVDGEEAITWGAFLAINNSLSAEEIDEIEADLLAKGMSVIGGGASAAQQIALGCRVTVKAGQNPDYTVEVVAETDGQAGSKAMLTYPHRLRGETVTYVVDRL